MLALSLVESSKYSTHNHLLLRTTIGCPECSTKCNVDLKKKLLILFPTMAEKQINGVLAKEDGRSKQTH